jgi:hypothetical protein
MEACRTWTSTQLTRPGSWAVAATLKKPPRKNTAAPITARIASSPMTPKNLSMETIPIRTCGEGS